jgi:hypothetical protein
MEEFGKRAPTNASSQHTDKEVLIVEEFLTHTTFENMFQHIMTATTEAGISVALRALSRIFSCTAGYRFMTEEKNTPYIQGGISHLQDSVRLFTLQQLKAVCLAEPWLEERIGFLCSMLKELCSGMSDENIEVMQVAEDILVGIAEAGTEAQRIKLLQITSQIPLKDSTVQLRVLSLVTRIATKNPECFKSCNSRYHF